MKRISRTSQIIITAILILSISMTGCTPASRYPKIITLGFVNGGSEISVLDLNNSTRQYVTEHQGISPTSYSYCEAKKQVVYSAFVEDGEELIFEDLTDYRTGALTQGNNHFRLPVWSPDCSMLAFTSFGSDPNVFILNPENSQTHSVSSQPRISLQGAVWSPNSHLLATYIPVPSTNSNQQKFDLGIVDIATNKLVTKINGSIAYPFSEVAWNADSDKIYYSAMRDAASFDVYMFNLNDSIETSIIQTEFQDVYPVLSPDGKHLLFLQALSNKATYLVGLLDLASKNVEMLTANPMVISASLWLDNQRSLLSEYNLSSNQTIYYVLNTQTKALKEISRFDGRFTNPKILQP